MLRTPRLSILLAGLAAAPAAAADMPARVLNDWASRNNAGHLAEYKANLDRAAMAFRGALDVLRPYQDEVPDLLIRSRADYARVLLAMGRAEEAEPLARQVVDARRSRPRFGPAQLGKDLNQLALTLLRLGRHEEAGKHLREALPLLERAAVPDRPDLVTTLETLAAVSARLGRAQDAIIFYKRALVVREATSRDGIPIAEQAEVEARRLAEFNRIDQFIKLEMQARAIREASAESPGAAAAVEDLARLLRQAGRVPEAGLMEARAREIRDRLSSNPAPDAATRPAVPVGGR